MKKLLYILLVALFAGCIKVNDAPVAEEDAALVSLLCIHRLLLNMKRRT